MKNKLDQETVLEIKDLVVRFIVEDEVVEAVNGIDLSLKKGHTIGLVGETGAGKTTTAKAIMNMIPSPPGKIERGEIYVCGNNVLQMTPSELQTVRGNDVSMIFQDPMTSLNPVFTVGDQIAESISLHEKVSKDAALMKAGDMLELVGIPRNRLSDYPHQFSGGMKQRVVIAIALSCNPQLLIADEPTTALDVTIQAQVLELMRELREKYGMAIIMITHDLGIIAEMCDEVAVMYAGQLVEVGTLDDIFNHTLHPYTEGLFNSLPNIRNRKHGHKVPLKTIPGLMPDPTNLPKGCAFSQRCAYATPECSGAKQQMIRASETHRVLCSRYNEQAFHIERGN